MTVDFSNVDLHDLELYWIWKQCNPKTEAVFMVIIIN